MKAPKPTEGWKPGLTEWYSSGVVVCTVVVYRQTTGGTGQI